MRIHGFAAGVSFSVRGCATFDVSPSEAHVVLNVLFLQSSVVLTICPARCCWDLLAGQSILHLDS